MDLNAQNIHATVNRRIGHGLTSEELVAGNFSEFSGFLLLELAFDPLVGDGESLFKRSARLPAQHLAQQGVVAVAAANALRLGQVMPLRQLFAGDAADHVDEVVDADHFVGAEVEGLAMVRGHQADQAFDAIIHVHVGTRLMAVAPDLDLAAIFRVRDFTGDRSRRLLLAAVVGSQRTVNVVEADDARLEFVIAVVVAAKLFGEELLPTVARLGIGGIGVLFLQRNEIGRLLLVLRVNASRRGEEELLHAILLARLEHVRVDENVVLGDIGQERRDVTDAAHIGREVVDLIDPLGRREAVFPHAQVQNLEVISSRGFVLGMLNVDPTYPVAIRLQTLDEMMTDETTCPSYQNTSLVCHCVYSPSLFFSVDSFSNKVKRYFRNRTLSESKPSQLKPGLQLNLRIGPNEFGISENREI